MWVAGDPQVLHFLRGDGLGCIVNLSGSAVDLPEDASVLIASQRLDGGQLPVDTAAWYEVAG